MGIWAFSLIAQEHQQGPSVTIRNEVGFYEADSREHAIGMAYGWGRDKYPDTRLDIIVVECPAQPLSRSQDHGG